MTASDDAGRRWVMVPTDSEGVEVRFDVGDGKGVEIVCDAATVARVAPAAGGAKGRFVVKPLGPGAATLRARKGGKNLQEAGRELTLEVAVLPRREVKTAFVVVETFGATGSIRSSPTCNVP